ncbi:MAG: murein biosynthesis integral membrane protein MurJ, partial [Candidatus Binatia bacterium]
PGTVAEKSLRRAAGGIGLAVLASRLLGLVREVVFTTLFGAGRELDAFIAAFRIPNLLRDLFAEGALSAAFVSTFSRKLDREGEPAAWRLASLVMNDLLLVVGAIVLVGIAFSPGVVAVVAPGFEEDPGKLELTVSLTRLLFPFLLLVTLAAVAMGVLNARSVFGIPASASSFFNLGSILGGIAFAWLLSPGYVESVFRVGFGGGAVDGAGAPAALVGMALGTLLGGALQFLVQVPALRRVGFRYRWSAGFTDPGVREVLRLMGPATIGIAAVQVNVVVNTIFASGLGDGPVSWLSVAFRLMYLPIGMFGVALGTVVLPSVSRAASRDDLPAFREKIAEALQLLLFLCIPAAVGLAVAAEPIIGLIYEHGRFDASDTHAAGLALAAYSIGLTGYASIKVLGPAFFALNDTRIPMAVSLLSVAVNLALNWMAVRVFHLGHGGLALSTSLVALWNSALLFLFLRRKIGTLPRGLGPSSLRVLGAAAAMGIACRAWIDWLGPGGGGSMHHLRVVATTVPLGVAFFAVAGWILAVPEVRKLAGFRRVLTPPGGRPTP